jgi:hypothetical protein
MTGGPYRADAPPSASSELHLVPLDAGWATEGGVLRLQLWPLPPEGRAAEPIELVFRTPLPAGDQQKLAENIARRLGRDLFPLPPR